MFTVDAAIEVALDDEGRWTTSSDDVKRSVDAKPELDRQSQDVQLAIAWELQLLDAALVRPPVAMKRRSLSAVPRAESNIDARKGHLTIAGVQVDVN